jgi:hypothetical protein
MSDKEMEKKGPTEEAKALFLANKPKEILETTAAPPNPPPKKKEEVEKVAAPPPPPPPKQHEEEAEEDVIAPPPPPPSPPGPPSEAGSIDTAESIDTVESLDTVEPTEEKSEEETEKNIEENIEENTKDTAESLPFTIESEIEKNKIDSDKSENIAEEKISESKISESKIDKKTEESDTTVKNDTEPPVEKTSKISSVDELQAMFDAQLGDLEKQLLNVGGQDGETSNLSNSILSIDNTTLESMGESKDSTLSTLILSQKEKNEENESENEYKYESLSDEDTDIDLGLRKTPYEPSDTDEDIPNIMGWRPKARNAVLKRARPTSPSPKERLPIQPGLGAIDIFDPSNIKLPSKRRMKKLRSLAISKLWCPEGIEMLWDAVMMIDSYTPTAKRFASQEMRNHMNVQMQSFRREQVRRFLVEIKKALDSRSSLPDNFQAESQYTCDYWNWEFKNLSYSIVTTLQEVGKYKSSYSQI